MALARFVLRLTWVALAALLYGLSLEQVAFFTGEDQLFGWQCLLLGWMYTPAWLANLTAVGSAVLLVLGFDRMSAVSGVCNVVLGSWAIFAIQGHVLNPPMSVPFPMCALPLWLPSGDWLPGPGFLLWLMALGAFAPAGLVCRIFWWQTRTQAGS